MDDEATSVEEAEEVTSEEPSDEAETQEPSEGMEEADSLTSDEEEGEQRVYAKKFKSVDELEKAYENNNSQTSKLFGEIASLKKSLEEMKLSPQEKKDLLEREKLAEQFGFATKADLEREVKAMQQERNDSENLDGLRKRGIPQWQLDVVNENKQFGRYASMAVADIYRSIYGNLPKSAPKQGVGSKPRAKGNKGQYTAQQIKDMSWKEYQEKKPDIAKRGVVR